jgi:two-component system, NtrC family, sensor kinase
VRSAETPPTATPPIVVPVLASDAGAAPVVARVVDELRTHLPEIEPVPDADVSASLDRLGPDAPLPLVIVVASEEGTTTATIDALADGGGPLADATVLVVTDRPVHHDLSAAVDRGLLAGLVAATWRDGLLAPHARSHIARWFRHRGGEALPAAWSQVATTVGAEWAPVSDLLQDLELDDHAIAERLTAALDAALGPRPRLVLAPGTRLTRQDVEVNGVYVVRSGSVALDRSTAVGEVRLHHRSTGPVVGLLSLAQQRRAFFTARATTEVEAIHLTVEQLDVAVHESPAVAAALAAGAVRALAARLRRSEQLQVEKRQLNLELEAERRRLTEAYAALEAARLELVEQARFATLGELAAGVAHELNNPVAALSRAASFVTEDVLHLLADHPDAGLLVEVVEAARDRPPARPADERAARRVLTDALGDDALARRLAAAGITDPEHARTLVAGHRADAVELVERAAGLGTAVRNLEVASRRIGELVASLRAYARPDGAAVEQVDLHVGIEDTLRLVAHQLEDIEVVRDYGDLPPVRAHPGQLGQVWTNLLVNAADAIAGGEHGRGQVEVVTDQPDLDHVRVRIIDDGPGIPPAERARLFEPRFTTKDGAIRYGLGLGLPISKRIVEAHGGTISVESAPGRTVATVVLPVDGPGPDGAPGTGRRTTGEADR